MSFSEYSRTAGHLVAEAFAALLGAPTPAEAALVFAVQVRRETADGDPTLSPGVRSNNPLNLTTAQGRIVWPGQTGTYSGGNAAEWHGDFAAFGSIGAGANACALNYSASTYDEVQRAFRGGDPIALAEAIQASPWDSGHYGGTFVDEVRAELGHTEVAVTDDEFLEKLHRLYTPKLQEQLETTVYSRLDQAQADIAKANTDIALHTHDGGETSAAKIS